MRRRLPLANVFLFSSFFLFVFIVTLSANFHINRALLSYQRQILHQLEQSLNIRIVHTRTAFASFDTLEFRSIRILGPGNTSAPPLATLEKLRISFDIVALITQGKPPLECMRHVELVSPVLFIYGNRSLFSVLGGGTTSGSTAASKPTIKMEVAVRDGFLRVMGGEQGGASILGELALREGRISLRPSGGTFFLESSLTLMPGSGLFTSGLQVEGRFRYGSLLGEALFSLRNCSVARVLIPRLDYRLTLEKEGVRLSSSTPGQPVQLQGRLDHRGAGRLQLKIDPDSGFLVTLLERNLGGGLEQPLFPAHRNWKARGDLTLETDGKQMRLRGDFAVLDRALRPAFRLLLQGDGGRLELRELRLQSEGRSLDLQGSWDLSEGLPRLRGRLVRMPLGGRQVSTTVDLRSGAEGWYRLTLGNLNLDGAALGTMASDLSMRSNGIAFDTRDLNPGVNGTGFINEGGAVSLKLDLKGFSMALLSRLVGGLPAAGGRSLTGKVSLSMSHNKLVSDGDLVVASASPRERLLLSYAYDGETLLLKDASLPMLDIGLRGTALFRTDSTLINMTMRYGKTSYPVRGSFTQKGTVSQISLQVGSLLDLSGSVGGAGTVLNLGLANFPLKPLGVQALASGRLSLRGDGGASGSLRLTGLESYQQDLRSLEAVFAVTGDKVDISRFQINHGSGSLVGSGRLETDAQGVQGVINLGPNCRAALEYRNRWINISVDFSGLELARVAPRYMQGRIYGALSLKGLIANPSLEADLRLDKGKLFDEAFSFRLRARAIPEGFSLTGGRIRFGGLDVQVRKGRYTSDAVGSRRVRLHADAAMRYPLLKVQGEVELEGRFASDSFDLLVSLANARINNKSLPLVASRIQYFNGEFQFLRKGPTGISGFLNRKRQQFWLKFFNENFLTLEATGRIGQRDLDFYLSSEQFQLDYLSFFPSLFQRADGTARLRLTVSGPVQDPRVEGYLLAKEGRFTSTLFRKPVRNFNMDIRFTDGKVLVQRVSGRVGDGSFLLEGHCYLRQARLEDFDLRLRTDKQKGLDFNINDKDLKIKGNVLADLFIKGDPAAPDVYGRIALKDNDIGYWEDAPSGNQEPAYTQRINWNMEITALQGTKYINEFVRLGIKPQSRIRLQGRISDPDFLVSGRIDATWGVIDYLNHEFRLEGPNYLEFKRTRDGFDPRLNYKGKLRLRDDNNEDVTVYMAFSGSLKEGFKPVFSSDPYKPDDEIRALLGIERSQETVSDGQRTSVLLKSTDILAALGLRVFVTRNLRKFLGLDLFTIRTPVFRNLLERDSLDLLDPRRDLSIWRNTQFSLGLYLFDFIFIEYTLTLKESVEDLGRLIPAHQLALELSFDFLNFGYQLKPTEKSLFKEYEHSLNMRIRTAFSIK